MHKAFSDAVAESLGLDDSNIEWSFHQTKVGLKHPEYTLVTIFDSEAEIPD